ncbi:MAG: prolipoprotein diacylglyceryl transferase [Candidatus Woesearchaeota archaeon]
MFYHNLSPVAFRIGDLEIRYYGLAWVLTFFLTLFLFKKYKKVTKIQDEDEFIIVLLLFIVLFSKLLFFLNDILFGWRVIDLNYILSHIFSGFSAIGGFIGTFFAFLFYKYVKKEKFSLPYTFSIFFMILMFGVAVGRIANFLNKEFYGTPSNLPFCVVFFEGDYCRHPVQLYESAYYFVIFIILLVLFKTKVLKHYEEGKYQYLLIDVGCGMYAIGRFFLEYFKSLPRLYFSLTINQIELIIMLAIYVIVRNYNNLKKLINKKTKTEITSGGEKSEKKRRKK